MITSFATNNWVTITIIFLIGILVVLNFLYEIRFSKFVSISIANEYVVDYINKSSSFVNFFDMLLLVFQVGSFSLLIVKVNEILHFIEVSNPFFLFLKVVLILLSYYFFRFLIGKLLAVVLELKSEQQLLSFIKMNYLSKVSVLIFPAIIVLYYFPNLNDFLLKLIMLITIVFLLFKYGQIIKYNQKLIFSNLFYFILYLCALEIIPLFFVFKLFINKG